MAKNAMLEMQKTTKDSALEECHGGELLAAESDLLLWVHRYEKILTHRCYMFQAKFCVPDVNIVTMGYAEVIFEA
jgi:hypothetical protein